MNGNPGNSGLIMMYKSSTYSRYLGKLNVFLKKGLVEDLIFL